MQLTVMVGEEAFVSVVEATLQTSIAEIIHRIESSEPNLPISSVLLNETILLEPPTSTLSSFGVVDEPDDVVVLTAKVDKDVMELLQHFHTNHDALDQLLSSNPQIANAVLSSDFGILKQVVLAQKQHNALASADQFDEEAQRAIEAQIKQSNVMKNYEAAVEHNPEAFGQVVMLYVMCEVDGKQVAAFVDSGAQSTIMSKNCAERLGLLRLLDTRFAGIARGVGTAKIMGRVHMAEMKLGSHIFPISITVLEDDGMEFLFGLDNLRKHEASIDLKQSCLIMGGERVPFMSEGDIAKAKKHDHVEVKEDTLSPAEPPEQSSPQFPEDDIELLIGLGFRRELAIEGLTMCNGDTELAAGLLFQST